jgi:hypothetical protein
MILCSFSLTILLSYSLTNSDSPAIYVILPADFEVLPKVIHGFTEEARTCGFLSPSIGGFGFAVVIP